MKQSRGCLVEDRDRLGEVLAQGPVQQLLDRPARQIGRIQEGASSAATRSDQWLALAVPAPAGLAALIARAVISA